MGLMYDIGVRTAVLQREKNEFELTLTNKLTQFHEGLQRDMVSQEQIFDSTREDQTNAIVSNA